MPARTRVAKGMTLVELLIVLAILILVAGLSLPDLHAMAAGSRVKATATRFMTHVNLARITAIMRARRVVLCPSADGSRCLPDGYWHLGWLVFIDLDSDREHTANEPLLEVGGAAEAITLVTSRMRRRMVFYPTGMSPGSNGTFVTCSTSEGAAPLAVIVSNSGRARLSRRRPDGSPLSCS